MDDQGKEADQPVKTPEDKAIALTNRALAAYIQTVIQNVPTQQRAYGDVPYCVETKWFNFDNVDNSNVSSVMFSKTFNFKSFMFMTDDNKHEDAFAILIHHQADTPKNLKSLEPDNGSKEEMHYAISIFYFSLSGLSDSIIGQFTEKRETKLYYELIMDALDRLHRQDPDMFPNFHQFYQNFKERQEELENEESYQK